MIEDQAEACRKTGFVERHAIACQSVADRMNCIILFREPGKAARGLIADNYAMKGFRIDTKSCNWGPMCGFVCADPRLSKLKDKTTRESYTVRNATWTAEALAGHINHDWFGDPVGPDVASWRAGVMPIVISSQRIIELLRNGTLPQTSRDADGSFFGVAAQEFGDETGTIILPWRLVPVQGATDAWLRDENRNLALSGRYFVLCIDPRSAYRFEQRYVAGVNPIYFTRGSTRFETILGMINPGTAHRGFKACVTADYDLFATWPSERDQMGPMHGVIGQLAQLRGRDRNWTPSLVRHALAPGNRSAQAMPAGVARMPGIDDRLKAAGPRGDMDKPLEHYRFGDVSARVLTMKVMLNTAIQGEGRYRGGNAIHHNDEAGNFALAKDNLGECLPLIGFIPSLPGADKMAARTPARTVCIENIADFRELGLLAKANGFTIVAKDAWKTSAGLH